MLSVLDGGEVNFSKSNKDLKPCQLYYVDNIINETKAEVLFEYCSANNKVTVKSFIINQEVGVCDN